MNNKFQLFLVSIIFQAIIGCAPKLTFTEIKEKVNKQYIAFNENDIEYAYKNTLVKVLKEYGNDGFRKRLKKIYELKKENKYPVVFDEIGELRIQDLNKCNSIYFYKVKYLVDKAQMTPYLDSIALELNYKTYGKENVNFNPNSKILETRLRKEGILLFDKDKIWKIYDYESFNNEWYDRYFGKGFSKCLRTKVENSEYLLYW